MLIVPIVLLVALLIIVAVANAKRKKGEMSDASYQTLVSVSSIIVTIGALVVLFLRLRT
jgi:heme/copper-type cytochrome/quinol oxidase subunit 2